MKDTKKIKKIAQQIVQLELECKKYKDNIPKQKEILNQMEKLTEGLSLEELLSIDIYIVENNLLKK